MKKRFTTSLLILLAMLTFQSCEEALETSLIDKKVTLLAPANNITTSNTNQTFYWETIDGAAEYQLQVVNPKFDSIAQLITDTIINKNQFVIEMNGGDYQWRVKAINNSSSSQYSDAWNLAIQ